MRVCFKNRKFELEVFSDGDVYFKNGREHMIENASIAETEREEICRALEALKKVSVSLGKRLK